MQLRSSPLTPSSSLCFQDSLPLSSAVSARFLNNPIIRPVIVSNILPLSLFRFRHFIKRRVLSLLSSPSSWPGRLGRSMTRTSPHRHGISFNFAHIVLASRSFDDSPHRHGISFNFGHIVLASRSFDDSDRSFFATSSRHPF